MAHPTVSSYSHSILSAQAFPPPPHQAFRFTPLAQHEVTAGICLAQCYSTCSSRLSGR